MIDYVLANRGDGDLMVKLSTPYFLWIKVKYGERCSDRLTAITYLTLLYLAFHLVSLKRVSCQSGKRPQLLITPSSFNSLDSLACVIIQLLSCY